MKFYIECHWPSGNRFTLLHGYDRRDIAEGVAAIMSRKRPNVIHIVFAA